MKFRKKCEDCADEGYLLIMCCSGRRECGCMGLPVDMENCKTCNSNGKKRMGNETEYYVRSMCGEVVQSV